MSNKPEAKLKERVQSRLKKLDNCWFFKTDEGAVRGIPDIIGCIEGRFFAMELKHKRAKADKRRESLQKLTLRHIRMAGGLGYFKVDEENFKDVIARIAKARKRD